jgi:hypothetical protein
MWIDCQNRSLKDSGVFIADTMPGNDRRNINQTQPGSIRGKEVGDEKNCDVLSE